MYCDKCGAQLGKNDKFCKKCGAKNEYAQETLLRYSNNKKELFLFLLPIVFLIIGFVGKQILSILPFFGDFGFQYDIQNGYLSSVGFSISNYFSNMMTQNILPVLFIGFYIVCLKNKQKGNFSLQNIFILFTVIFFVLDIISAIIGIFLTITIDYEEKNISLLIFRSILDGLTVLSPSKYIFSGIVYICKNGWKEVNSFFCILKMFFYLCYWADFIISIFSVKSGEKNT